MDPREERLARNEILFREINESIEAVAKTQGADDHVYEFLCECSNVDCTLALPMELPVYEVIRSEPHVFVVAPGHELPEIEDVVRRAAGFQVVRKRGDAARLADQTDPRG